jgi:tRNA(fMet)-specific endonuclease VapC
MKPRYMLDTNICIYIAKHQPPEVKARFERLRPGQLVMSAITYGELSYGTCKSIQRAKALTQLEELVRLDCGTRVWGDSRQFGAAGAPDRK